MATAAGALPSSLLPDPATRLHIRELLRSNSQSPDHIRSTISALSDELAHYDARIAALREQLTGLEATRAALKAHSDDCEGLLAPIRRLPSELLVKIFGMFSSTEQHTCIIEQHTCIIHLELGGGDAASQSGSSAGRLPRELSPPENSQPELLGNVANRGYFPSHATLVIIQPLPNSFFHQLRTVQCMEILEPRFGEAASASLMPRLSQMTHFTMKLLPRSSFSPYKFRAQAITSDISALTIEVVISLSPINNVGLGPTVAKVVGTLTLPSLEEIKLISTYSLRFPLPWPHSEFIALSVRSSFHTHLKALHISHSILTETELIECLANLPLLESLSVSDHDFVVDGSTPQPLITNGLLAHLTAAPATPSLVPRLRVLRCRSRLQFDDHLYLKFLLSRMQNGCVFETQLIWLPGHHRDLAPIVVARLHTLCLRGQLVFLFGLSGGT
ncbi:hypothetical protein B0H17DRAFT_1180742 [Mycena rosella]|uniref:F-box domain-containing protein n=1 Tax=Mycena rosella TaxID=1033263 RepID=A0AAD7DD82_MYCRO|nr:hypothetical protein B0H17DRAFT_1180742 [Mycena rosella]